MKIDCIHVDGNGKCHKKPRVYFGMRQPLCVRVNKGNIEPCHLRQPIKPVVRPRRPPPPPAPPPVKACRNCFSMSEYKFTECKFCGLEFSKDSSDDY